MSSIRFLIMFVSWLKQSNKMSLHIEQMIRFHVDWMSRYYLLFSTFFFYKFYVKYYNESELRSFFKRVSFRCGIYFCHSVRFLHHHIFCTSFQSNPAWQARFSHARTDSVAYQCNGNRCSPTVNRIVWVIFNSKTN